MILGAKVAGPVHAQSEQTARETLATKIAIQGALGQAVLGPEDIQIVELRHGSNLGVQQALGALNVTEDGHASPISNPFIGSTGLAGLCELSKSIFVHSLPISQLMKWRQCGSSAAGPKTAQSPRQNTHYNTPSAPTEPHT